MIKTKWRNKMKNLLILSGLMFISSAGAKAFNRDLDKNGACYIEVSGPRSNTVERCIDEISLRQCWKYVNDLNDEFDRDSKNKSASCIAKLIEFRPKQRCL
jgi:hypothetical protein